MSFFRSVLIASLISLVAAGVLLFAGFLMGYEEFRGGYAVLSVDDSIEDRSLRSILDTGLLLGVEPISESSQWVMLDEFDTLRRIPLDTYHSRIFPFDPRYDGYADKLKKVFVRDGKRFVYIPLIAGNWNSSLLDKKFREILGDISYSINYYGIGRPLSLFFIVYAAASVLLLFMCYIKRKKHRSIVNIIPMVPVLSSLGFFGAAGIGCAALLFGLFILLKEPLADLVNPVGTPAAGYKEKINKLYKEIILPYRYFWLFLPVFIFGFTIFIIFSPLKLLFLIIVSAASFAVFFVSLKIVSFSGVEHRRFNPVTIMRKRFPEFVFPMYILPFVAGAFITMFFTPYMSGSYDSGVKFDAIVDEQDYYEHLAYQASFSTRQMGSLSGDFPSYFFDKDGLPSVSAASTKQSVNFSDFPPFPLKHLMEFFNNVNSGEKTNTDVNTRKHDGGLAEKLSLLILLLFLLPGLTARKKDGDSRKINFDGFKRFSGKLGLIGINWNKKLLYNKKHSLFKRKDA